VLWDFAVLVIAICALARQVWLTLCDIGNGDLRRSSSVGRLLSARFAILFSKHGGPPGSLRMSSGYLEMSCITMAEEQSGRVASWSSTIGCRCLVDKQVASMYNDFIVTSGFFPPAKSLLGKKHALHTKNRRQIQRPGRGCPQVYTSSTLANHRA
jgi:hypothetical protein